MKLKAYLFSLFVLTICCLTIGLIYSRNHQLLDYTLEQKQYFQALHLLQKFGGSILPRNEPIPGFITRDDTTAALANHNNPVLILEKAASMFAALPAADFPQAPLYEAYCFLTLGQTASGMEKLLRYLPEAPYDPYNYALVSQYALVSKNYTTQYLICLEWQTQDAACNSERIFYTFVALMNMQRLEDAQRFVEKQGDCLDESVASLYEASLLTAKGETTAAAKLVQQALDSSPPDSRQQLLAQKARLEQYLSAYPEPSDLTPVVLSD